MIKAILFDFDGILFDTEHYYNALETAYLDEIHSPLPKERTRRFICADNSTDFFAYVIEGYEDVVDKETLKRQFTEFWENDERMKNPPFEDLIFEDVTPMLKWLKENGYQLACASRSPLAYVQEGLRRGGILEYFDVITSGECFQLNKPNPECYLYCMKELGRSREECLIVEDSTNGIKAGKNAGIQVVVRKDIDLGLDQSGGDYYVDDYYALKEILKENK